MAAPRTYLVNGSGSGAGGIVTGGDANALFGGVFDRLQDNSLPWATVTSAGSEGDTVTADILSNEVGSPVDARFLERGWQAGMGVRMAWPAENTGGVTLAINGGTALSIVTPEGAAMSAAQLPAGIVVELVYFDGAFVCVSPLPAATDGVEARYFYKLTVSATWTKPLGLGDNTAWSVGMWGGGGGGRNFSGTVAGGGGAFAQGVFRHGDLPATVAVTVGAGGALSAAGGNSTFGSLLTAYGGGPGVINDHGGGGGSLGSGAAGQAGRLGGGGPNEDAATIYGGGGGGTSGAFEPGAAVWGGGGGGASTVFGVSVFGGNGGANGVAGAPRGGGGGSLGVGGRGEIWIWN